jgi:hypothetical protein
MSEYLDLSNGNVEPITEESWEAQKSVSIPSHRVKDSNFILEMFEENGDDSSEGDDLPILIANLNFKPYLSLLTEISFIISLIQVKGTNFTRISTVDTYYLPSYLTDWRKDLNCKNIKKAG